MSYSMSLIYKEEVLHWTTVINLQNKGGDIRITGFNKTRLGLTLGLAKNFSHDYWLSVSKLNS